MTDTNPSPRKINPLSLRDVAIMSLQIGFTVAISALLFVWGGKFLDEKFETGKTFTIAGIIVGLLAAIVVVWNIVKPLRENAKSGFQTMKKETNSNPKNS